jgi:hypothetical protein
MLLQNNLEANRKITGRLLEQNAPVGHSLCQRRPGRRPRALPGHHDAEALRRAYDNRIKDLNLKAADAPPLAGEVVNADQQGACASMKAIIDDLPKTIPNCCVVSSKSRACRPDHLHLTPAGCRESGLGKRRHFGGSREAVQPGRREERLECRQVKSKPFIPNGYHSYIKHSIVKMSGNE